MFTCLYSVLLWQRLRVLSPWVFCFVFFLYLIYAVFMRLVLHYVWQSFCCPFYSHFSCMSVGVLYACVLASVEKYFVILPDFTFHKKINSFVWKSLSCLFLWFSFPLLPSFVHPGLSYYLNRNVPFYRFVYHHSSCIITHFYLCCHLWCPSPLSEIMPAGSLTLISNQHRRLKHV